MVTGYLPNRHHNPQQRSRGWFLVCIVLALSACGGARESDPQGPDQPSLMETVSALNGCRILLHDGLRDIPDQRADRFLGKVQPEAAECRGGKRALAYQNLGRPWLDWPGYWATGDGNSRNATYDDNWLNRRFASLLEGVHIDPNVRGIDGALIDLEFERVELIKFNLFDNATYHTYLTGRDGQPGTTIDRWPEMRLPQGHPQYETLGGAGEQKCSGELIRARTVTGICNDIFNPLMGSTHTLFARNVQFEETFPDQGLTDLTRARHGNRLGLLKPDPQLISRRLFTRPQSAPAKCNLGMGMDEHTDAQCDYQKAPFMNVLAAFWIQFMTHDWFSHLEEGGNADGPLAIAGCSDEPAQTTGCRANDAYQPSLVAQSGPAPTIEHKGSQHLTRAPKTFANNVTAWWDASQIYGFDTVSASRVKRDPLDRARLRLESINADGERFLPRFAQRCNEHDETTSACDHIAQQWQNQETAAFADNWTIGMSFYHNVFSREHNAFVDAFRSQAAATPGGDSGLRNPQAPDHVIVYAQVTDEELYQAARLVIAAEIAKIHTIEWTTQLLYNEPLYRGMNANWNGLLDGGSERAARALEKVVTRLRASDKQELANSWYSALAAGPGIFGSGSKRYASITGTQDIWNLADDEHVNGGTNHFGSPFNFPEEFTTVYRLHPLVPDLLELRSPQQPDVIKARVSAGRAFRDAASDLMQREGAAAWALSMGRQRLGALQLNNHALFLQNLPLPHLGSDSGRLDIAALDLIRDRERGVPRFNEFRRQYGLRQLSSFDDFIDVTAAEATRVQQASVVDAMRDIYGQHICEAGKIISHAQKTPHGRFPNDCLGYPNGTLVDNIEDLDTVVGWLAEPVRPHGFAISETQFVVFVLNASRRLYSDRFFTSSFRPEFYTSLGHQWVMDNGPAPMLEKASPSGDTQPVSPMKRVLLRTIPELASQLDSVENVFDPWARDRGEYYSLEWRPRAGAEADPAFQ